MPWHWTRGKQPKVSTEWENPSHQSSQSAAQEARLQALYAWERRCRGYDLFPEAVALEPAFVPFLPWTSAQAGGWDAVPQALYRPEEWLTLRLLFPVEDGNGGPRGSTAPTGRVVQAVTPAHLNAFFSALRALQGQLSLEMAACARWVCYQVACEARDGEVVLAALRSTFPSARIEVADDALFEALAQLDEERVACAAVDMGLYEAVYQPLRLFENFASAPQGPLLSQLGSLKAGQMAGVQLLVAPASQDWGQSLSELVAQFDGVQGGAHPGTGDNDLVRALRYKLGSPLWAVALRLFAAVDDSGKSTSQPSGPLDLCRALAASLAYSGETPSNGLLTNRLMALDDRSYSQSEHFGDVLRRQTRRTGMLLSQGELLGLWHPPLPSMAHPRLLRFDARLRPLPDYLREAAGAILGWQDFGDRAGGNGTGGQVAGAPEKPPFVPWPDAFRNRHAYLLGATRMGKSTLLLNLIVQDMLAGRGLCLIDPHGDLAQDVLQRVPPPWEDDVLYLDLADSAFPPALGLLEASEEWEKRLLVSDLLAILHRLFASSWGDRLEHILRHALLTLLADTEEGHTLRDIRPLLAAKPYRDALLSRLGEEHGDLKSFWASEFPVYSTASFAPVYNKLGLLMSSPLVRNIVAGEGTQLHTGKLIQNRRILLVNLNQSLIGEDNAHFLGALLVSKIQLAAMHNLRYQRSERTPFTLYVDEFQNFVVSSFEKILSEAGKAGLSLVMANQFLEQLSPSLQQAIVSNIGTLVSFRVSAESGRTLQGEFGGHYGARELTDLQRGQAVVRLGKAGDSYLMRTFPPVEPELVEADHHSPARIQERTREEICRPRAEVEAQLRQADLQLQTLIAQAEAAEKQEKEAAKDAAKEAKTATAKTTTAKTTSGKGAKAKTSGAKAVEDDPSNDAPHEDEMEDDADEVVTRTTTVRAATVKKVAPAKSARKARIDIQVNAQPENQSENQPADQSGEDDQPTRAPARKATVPQGPTPKVTRTKNPKTTRAKTTKTIPPDTTAGAAKTSAEKEERPEEVATDNALESEVIGARGKDRKSNGEKLKEDKIARRSASKHATASSETETEKETKPSSSPSISSSTPSNSASPEDDVIEGEAIKDEAIKSDASAEPSSATVSSRLTVGPPASGELSLSEAASDALSNDASASESLAISSPVASKRENALTGAEETEPPTRLLFFGLPDEGESDEGEKDSGETPADDFTIASPTNSRSRTTEDSTQENAPANSIELAVGRSSSEPLADGGVGGDRPGGDESNRDNQSGEEAPASP